MGYMGQQIGFAVRVRKLKTMLPSQTGCLRLACTVSHPIGMRTARLAFSDQPGRKVVRYTIAYTMP